jgi:hypothetical protein
MQRQDDAASAQRARSQAMQTAERESAEAQGNRPMFD